MGKNDIVDDLYNAIHTVNEIYCTACKAIDTCHDMDAYDAATLFHDKGWSSNEDGEVYCKKCVKKQLKK